MEHEEVLNIVKKWLIKEYTSPREIEESGVGDPFADLIVHTPHQQKEYRFGILHLQVECKQTNAKAIHVDQAIGQCLRYHVNMKGLLTFLAIPEDYQQFKEIQKFLDFGNYLPIGLLIVHHNGTVDKVREPKGRSVIPMEEIFPQVKNMF